LEEAIVAGTFWSIGEGCVAGGGNKSAPRAARRQELTPELVAAVADLEAEIPPADDARRSTDRAVAHRP
jgi:hypothetical protein